MASQRHVVNQLGANQPGIDHGDAGLVTELGPEPGVNIQVVDAPAQRRQRLLQQRWHLAGRNSAGKSTLYRALGSSMKCFFLHESKLALITQTHSMVFDATQSAHLLVAMCNKAQTTRLVSASPLWKQTLLGDGW